MTEVTMEQVLAALQQTPEGRTQLELATQRAVIDAQARRLAELEAEAPSADEESAEN
tara:strand:- start:3768 stop:3938 length:171 start_codon:yes stop_codon:yes gene_type:complete